MKATTNDRRTTNDRKVNTAAFEAAKKIIVAHVEGHEKFEAALHGYDYGLITHEWVDKAIAATTWEELAHIVENLGLLGRTAEEARWQAHRWTKVWEEEYPSLHSLIKRYVKAYREGGDRLLVRVDPAPFCVDWGTVEVVPDPERPDWVAVYQVAGGKKIALLFTRGATLDESAPARAIKALLWGEEEI